MAAVIGANVQGGDNIAAGSPYGFENLVNQTFSPPPLRPAETGRIGPTVAITSNNRSGVTVTCTATAHGLVTGDFCRILGTSVDAYNGHAGPVTRVDANSFTYVIVGTPANATGGTCQKVRAQ